MHDAIHGLCPRQVDTEQEHRDDGNEVAISTLGARMNQML